MTQHTLLHWEEHRTKRDMAYGKKDTSPFKDRKDRKRFEHLNYYEPDLSWKVTAEVRRIENPDTLKLPTSAGTIKEYLRWAELHFEHGGKALSLEAYRSVKYINHPIYSRELFIPFTDLTS